MTTHPILKQTQMVFQLMKYLDPVSQIEVLTLKLTELLVAAKNNGMLPHAAVGKNMKHSVHLKLAIS